MTTNHEAAARCGTCKFYGYREDSQYTGVCHLKPPVVFLVNSEPWTVFPEVYKTDWCGEHQLASLAAKEGGE